jgi:hypothetical protein
MWLGGWRREEKDGEILFVTHYEAACRATCRLCEQGIKHIGCTAPTIIQFAEDRAAECERLRRVLFDIAVFPYAIPNDTSQMKGMARIALHPNSVQKTDEGITPQQMLPPDANAK